MSGTGYVAEGIVFTDGQAAMRWIGRYNTITIFPSLEVLVNVHGHSGRTVVEFEDEK